MSRPPELYQWTALVSKRFPQISKPLAAGLALWSLSMILTRACSLSAVADRLAPMLGQPFHTVRERVRDRYRKANAKAGTHRAQREVSAC